MTPGGARPGLPSRRTLREFAESQRPEFEDLLRSFVEIPSVSTDPDHRMDVLRGAELAAATIGRFGGTASIHRAGGGHPLVCGDFHRSPDGPVIAVYNHLDVQPASRESEPWHSDPFVLEKRGHRYFGRGATDDKGPALTALFGIRAARVNRLPVNLLLLWESEEEIGSPHFEALLRRAVGRKRVHSVLISDTVWLSRKVPACTSGLRGFQGFRFRLRTAGRDGHSGDVGGAVRNPLAELMSLMTRIADPRTGRVNVPGFYDRVVPPTRREIRDFRDSGFSLAAYRREYGGLRLRTEDRLEVMKRIWARPTFDVHGVSGGYAGPGIKSIVPGEAEVKASCRLVPHQQPEEIFARVRDFVRSRNPDVEVLPAGSAPPFRTDPLDPDAERLREAMRFGFGKRPVFVRDGGSIGPAVTMRRVLGCPVQFLGLSLPGDGYHAPDESFDWRQAAGGIAAFAKYFELSARERPGRPRRVTRTGSPGRAAARATS